MERYQFIVGNEESGLRIDQFLAKKISTLSRRKVRAILDVGGCYVNNKRMHIASRQVRGGDKVRVEFTPEGLSKSRQKIFELLDEDILYFSDHVIAINKPPGLPSQATRDQDVMHAEVCLENWLKKNHKTAKKLVLLHRLDKETSGVLLFATSNETATWITDQFRHRELSKTYWAICYGYPKTQEFAVECYLSDIDRKSGLVSVVRSGGKSSATTFQLKAKSNIAEASLLECCPKTGRSHQIRVHLEHVGHGILGDKRYGKNQTKHLPDAVASEVAKHQMLHARSISFSENSNSEPVTITAQPPATFVAVLDALGLAI